MLGGKTPFTGDMMQLIMQKVMQKAPPLSTIRSDIPAEVDRVIMKALEIEPANRPPSVSKWIDELEAVSEDVDESKRSGKSRLVVMAPVGAEVYINDERKGSVGSSGRVILADIPAGRHVLRVANQGERDDERVIEVRPGAGEQVIQAQLRTRHGSQPSSSQGSSQGATPSSVMPGIVACSNCHSRFAEGVRFCGRCGGGSFTMISRGDSSSSYPCPRCSSPLPTNSRFCGRCGLNITPAMQPNTRSTPSFSPQSAFGDSGSNPVQVTRICVRCGGTYPPHIKFCGKCGLTLH
jgi:serine/threonine protein kinase